MPSLPDFRLETYLARWEFAARFHMTASDAESMSLTDLLSLAEPSDREAFEHLWLGYVPTFGGEALSLAAARATMALIARHDVPAHLERIGGAMRDGYNAIAADLGIADRTSCIGAGCRSLVNFTGVAEPLVPREALQCRRDGSLSEGGG